jgi:quercetin dioxygenase-like cupin family protein
MTSNRSLIVCALLLAAFGIAADEPLPDPLAAGWKGESVCRLLHAGAFQRVLHCTFPPGVGHERHYHAPHLGYVLDGGVMEITDANGTRVVTTDANTSWESDGIEWHEAVNVGDTTTSYLIIEPRN